MTPFSFFFRGSEPTSTVRRDSSVRRLQGRAAPRRTAMVYPVRKMDSAKVNSEVTLVMANVPEDIANVDDLEDRRGLVTVYNALKRLQPIDTPQPMIELIKHDTYYDLLGIGYKEWITYDNLKAIEKYNCKLRAAPIIDIAVHHEERGLLVRVKVVKQRELAIRLEDHPNGLTTPPTDTNIGDASDIPIMITKKRRIETLDDDSGTE